MTFESDRTLQAELAPGERLLWSGLPRQGLILRGQDIFLIPFSLLWGGFAFFWEFMATSKGAPTIFTLWGIPFVLVGIYIIVGRFFVDSYQRGRTCYGLTDQRVVIIRGLLQREVTSLSLKTLSEIGLREKTNGAGSIVFGPAGPFAAWSGAGWPGKRRTMPPCFELPGDVRKVYNLVREAQRRTDTK